MKWIEDKIEFDTVVSELRSQGYYVKTVSEEGKYGYEIPRELQTLDGVNLAKGDTVYHYGNSDVAYTLEAIEEHSKGYTLSLVTHTDEVIKSVITFKDFCIFKHSPWTINECKELRFQRAKSVILSWRFVYIFIYLALMIFIPFVFQTLSSIDAIFEIRNINGLTSVIRAICLVNIFFIMFNIMCDLARIVSDRLVNENTEGRHCNLQ